MDIFPFEFFDECEKQNIMLCNGWPENEGKYDFFLNQPEDVLNYCKANDIRSIILDLIFPDEHEMDVKQLKDRLQKYFQQVVAEILQSSYHTPNITEEFYRPVWDEMIRNLNEELSQVVPKAPLCAEARTESDADDQEDSDDEDDDYEDYLDDYLDAEMIVAWILHGNFRIKSILYKAKEDESQKSETMLYRNYAGFLHRELQKRRSCAIQENHKLEQEKQNRVLKEIEQQLHLQPQIETFKTQKARYEYADRLLVKWQMEHGDEWLTKKSVRALVEREYVIRTT